MWLNSNSNRRSNHSHRPNPDGTPDVVWQRHGHAEPQFQTPWRRGRLNQIPDRDDFSWFIFNGFRNIPSHYRHNLIALNPSSAEMICGWSTCGLHRHLLILPGNTRHNLCVPAVVHLPLAGYRAALNTRARVTANLSIIARFFVKQQAHGLNHRELTSMRVNH